MWTDPVSRSYQRRAGLAMAAYVVLLTVAMALEGVPVVGQSPLRYLVALLPAAPIVALFLAIARYIADQDEHLKAIETRKALLSTWITLVACTVLAFLELVADAPHLPYFFVVVGWFGALMVGYVRHQREQQARGTTPNFRLQVLRAERRLTQDDVAERLGISRLTVDALENGRHDPSLSLAYRVAELLGVPVGEAFPPPGGAPARGAAPVHAPVDLE